MKRKVVKQGPASYMISLPKNWITQKEIKKGQELEVSIEGESILISIDNLESLKETKVFIFDEISLDEIYRSYSEGFSEIKISFKTEKDFDIIEKNIHNLIGADILERGKNDAQILFSNYKFKMEKNKNIIKILYLLKWEIQSIQKEIQDKHLRSIEEIEEISLELSSKISFFLRQIFFSRGIGSDYLRYKTGFESLKNIQKGVILFYKNLDRKNSGKIPINELKTIEEIIEEIIRIFSNKNNFSENFSKVITKINNEMGDRKNKLFEPSFFFLINTIFIGLESFCQLFKSLSNTRENPFSP